MKLLVATAETQGQRASDFTWCIPGEVVIPAGFTCDTDRGSEDPDAGCGCARSFLGLSSRRATTTAAVKGIDGYTAEDLAEAIRSSGQQAGFGDDGHESASRAQGQAALIADCAAAFDDGDVLEVRLGKIRRRR